MLRLSEGELMAALAALLWPLARLLGFFGVAPVLGNRALPARAKIGLAFALALTVAPLLSPPAVEPFSARGLVLLASEAALGMALGFAMRIAFAVVDLAGELVGLQMGLGFATFFDPQTSASGAVVAQLFGTIAALLFLALDGHLLMLSLLVESFHTLPPGASLPAASAFEIARWGAIVFSSGLALALPVVAALLIGNLALGALSRAVPQLGLFAIGFPLQLLAGLALLALALELTRSPLEQLFEQALAFAARLGAR
jgi:flagellar biosynthetic protein FliR